MAESPTAVALDAAAPAAERYDAQAALTQSALELNNTLFGSAELAATFDHIQSMYAEQDLAKGGSNLIQGPWGDGNRKKPGERGPKSVIVDTFQQVGQVGGYWERPGALSFLSMRSMVEQTPILNSIIQHRLRQVQRFCQPQMDDTGPGFVIKHRDKNYDMSKRDLAAVQMLQKFVMNGGWEFDPRRRKQMKRNTFGQFMAKAVRDTLVMDACPIETEWKRDRSLGIDGFYALDGATIRLCTEEGYEGDDEIFALQVIEGNVRSTYNYEQLIYEVRNPRTDVTACGYGYSETEMLIRIVTYMLNTLTYNASFFDKNSIPRGFMNLFGNYSKEDLIAFKRYWNGMVRGANNHHNLPVMISKDQESGAEYVPIDGALDEMAFSKWLVFLTSISCAIYGAEPSEISMESFSTQSSTLGKGDDTGEKVASSNDKGLRPLLSFFQSTISDFIIQPFSEDYQFQFVGLDEEDKKQAFESRKLSSTWDEMRASSGQEPLEDKQLGSMPINPSLIPAWQAVTGIGQPQPDFGNPDQFGEDSDVDGDDQGQNGGQGDGGASPAAEDDDDGFGPAPAAGAAPGGSGGAMTKALGADFGLAPAIYAIGED